MKDSKIFVFTVLKRYYGRGHLWAESSSVGGAIRPISLHAMAVVIAASNVEVCGSGIGPFGSIKVCAGGFDKTVLRKFKMASD